MAKPTEHEPKGAHQSKKAAASGWIGSALEYYDFFIYATAASLVFPQIFFPSGKSQSPLWHAGDLWRRFVARPSAPSSGILAIPTRAFVGFFVCMFVMGFATWQSPAPALWAGRGACAYAARHPSAYTGLCSCWRNLGRKFDDLGARSVRQAGVFRQLLSSGRAGGTDLGGGDLSAACGLHAR